MQVAATIHQHGNLRSESLKIRSIRSQGNPQLRKEWSRVERLACVETEQGGGEERGGTVGADPKGFDDGTEVWRRLRRQPANLEAAALGYFNDSVAMSLRRIAQHAELFNGDRLVGNDPCQQSIARLQRHCEGRAGTSNVGSRNAHVASVASGSSPW